MKYMISVIDDITRSATESEMVAIDVFNDRLRAEGHWVLAGGLASPNLARVIDHRGAEALITEGPLHASKEYVSGFWIIDVSDDETALQLAVEGSKACNRRVEVRRILGE